MKNGTKGFLAILGPVIGLGLVAATFYVIPEMKLKEAVDILTEDADKAIDILESLHGYKDSEIQLNIAKAKKSVDLDNAKEAVTYMLAAGGKINVTYDTDGGNEIDDETIDTRENSLDLAPEKENNTFVGWTITNYEFQDRNYTLNMDLTAQWVPVE